MEKDRTDEYIKRLRDIIAEAVSEEGLTSYKDDRRHLYTYQKVERPEYFIKKPEEKISYEAEELPEPSVKDSFRSPSGHSISISPRPVGGFSDINVYGISPESTGEAPSAAEGTLPGQKAFGELVPPVSGVSEPSDASKEETSEEEGPETETETETPGSGCPPEEEPETAGDATPEGSGVTEGAEEGSAVPPDIEPGTMPPAAVEAAAELTEGSTVDVPSEESPEDALPEETQGSHEEEAPSEEARTEENDLTLAPEEGEEPGAAEEAAAEESPSETEEPEEADEGPAEEAVADGPAEEEEDASVTAEALSPSEDASAEDIYVEAPEETSEASEAISEESPEENKKETAEELKEEEVQKDSFPENEGDGMVLLSDDDVLDADFFGDAPEDPSGDRALPEETEEAAVPEETDETLSGQTRPAEEAEVSMEEPEENDDEASLEASQEEPETAASGSPKEPETAASEDEASVELNSEEIIRAGEPVVVEETDSEAAGPEAAGPEAADPAPAAVPSEASQTKEERMKDTKGFTGSGRADRGKTVRRVRKKDAKLSGILLPAVYMSLSVFLMDIVMRLILDLEMDPAGLMDISTLYTLLFAGCAGSIMALISCLPKKMSSRRILASVLLGAATVIYLVEFFLKQTYGNYMGIRVIGGNAAAVAGSYSAVIWQVILKGIPLIVLFFVPLILMNVFFGKIFGSPVHLEWLPRLLLGVSCLVLGILIVMTSTTGAVSDRKYFTSRFNIDKGIIRFGMPAALTLDAVYMATGLPQDRASLYPVYVPTFAVEGYLNMLDIDFDAITAANNYWPIPQMDEYFKSMAPTLKNEYTGMFEGKNLVFIVAEAFTGYVINEQDTPTLYKMANEGFVFTNYYQPSWFVSTSDGEYSLLTGNIPDFSTQSMLDSRYNNMYYTPGNVFKRLGYRTMAFHNHYYQYYDRDLTHLNLGYEFWLAMDNGMEEYVEEIWPESDEEMFRGVSWYLTDCEGPFHAYFLTVSGHTEYNFSGNYMAKKNRDRIDGTGLSEPVWAIRAQNTELDRGLEYLMSELEAAGKLDDTVFVMSCDHYPYGMPDWAYNELAGKELDTQFERYHNTLFIYCSDMEEPIVIDKPCYGCDVIPTVYNLFGIDYDSRLFTGRDILSDADGLVIFNNYSWLTDKARYNAPRGELYVNDGVTLPEGYAETVSRMVSDRIAYAKYILNYDYYDLVF